MVGIVATPGTRKPASLFVPSARQMAKSALDAVGCGRTEIWAHYAHALQFGMLSWLPQSVMNTFAAKTVRELKAKEEELMKQQ